MLSCLNIHQSDGWIHSIGAPDGESLRSGLAARAAADRCLTLGPPWRAKRRRHAALIELSLGPMPPLEDTSTVTGATLAVDGGYTAIREPWSSSASAWCEGDVPPPGIAKPSKSRHRRSGPRGWGR